jgi:hypothetical protein
MLLYGV